LNRILILNMDDYWHPNARASVTAAANRWGCELIEVASLLGGRDFFHAKFYMGHFCHPDGRCLWLDADMVVSEDCPSPFDIVPCDHFGAVLNYQGDTHRGVPEQYQRPSWDAAAKMLNVPLPYTDDRYINGGFIMFGPQHKMILKTLAENLHDTKGVIEQAAWSVMMAMVPTTYLPRTFNRVGEAAWNSGPHMTAHIYHFANYMQFKGKAAKAARIAATQWRVHAHETINA